MKHNAKDEAGNRYGRLVVTALHTERYKGKNLQWQCMCACGKQHIALGVDLRAGSVRSCGCLARVLAAQRLRTHGKSKSRVYSTWNSMMDRCYRPSTEYFEKYGGRGIKVCERWHSFENFYEDMGDPPPQLSLDRINNDGDYTMENCRWANKQEQSVNRSVTRWIELNGERLHLTGWANRLGMSVQALSYRIKKFGIEIALTTPLGRSNFQGVK